MSEMVERVALAIFRQFDKDCGRGETTDREWALYSDYDKHGYRNQARAVIEAMREPT